MRKMVVWGSILGGSALVFLSLSVGALIWGVGILRDRLPILVDGGGIWLDAGEFEALSKTDNSVLTGLFRMFTR